MTNLSEDKLEEMVKEETEAYNQLRVHAERVNQELIQRGARLALLAELHSKAKSNGFDETVPVEDIVGEVKEKVLQPDPKKIIDEEE